MERRFAALVLLYPVSDMARNQGTTLFVIEQESYQGKAPLDCMKEDLAVMKERGY